LDLDRESPVPIYQQIAHQIRQKIENGTFQRGSKLPNEATLQNRYQASRITVRKAVSLLVKEGLVERKQGKGTFVSIPSVTMEMGALHGFYGSLVRTGAVIDTRLLQCHVVQASSQVASNLRIEVGSNIQMLERLYLLNESPLAVTTSYLWKDLGVSFAEASATTVYGLVTPHLRQALNTAHWIVTAEPASHRYEELLGVKFGYPLLCLSRVTATTDNVPREYTIHRVVSHLYQAHITLHREDHTLDEDFFIQSPTEAMPKPTQ
jgi:DNA-binding GntR family transcriptional regulator